MSELRHLDHATIGETLSKLKYTLLPGEIAEDEDARWVLARNGPDESNELETRKAWPTSAYAVYEAAAQIVAIILQDQIPFYFGTLFHIARQWKVSESLFE